MWRSLGRQNMCVKYHKYFTSEEDCILLSCKENNNEHRTRDMCLVEVCVLWLIFTLAEISVIYFGPSLSTVK